MTVEEIFLLQEYNSRDVDAFDVSELRNYIRLLNLQANDTRQLLKELSSGTTNPFMPRFTSAGSLVYQRDS